MVQMPCLRSQARHHQIRDTRAGVPEKGLAQVQSRGCIVQSEVDLEDVLLNPSVRRKWSALIQVV